MLTQARGLRAGSAMLTGLHEPGSTHLAMLEALAGREHLRIFAGYSVLLSKSKLGAW